MDDFTEYLTNVPHFDFNTAIEDFGFDFAQFQSNNFQEFTEFIIEDYINFRKGYILRNYSQVRAVAHKLRGLFA